MLLAMDHSRYSDFTWKGDRLYRGNSTKPVASIVPDATYPTMWRIQWPDGSLSDMLNKSRAKDHAIVAHLNDLKVANSSQEAA